MNLIPVILLAIVLTLMTQREKFTEIFGFSGYSKPVNVSVNEKLNSSIDVSNYEEKAAIVDNDTIQSLVFAVRSKLKLPSYAVETNSIKKFVDKADSSKIIYRCRFMFVYTKGFPFGFGVSADIMMTPKPTIVAMTTQPQSDQTYSPVEPFHEDIHDNFVNYNEVISDYSNRVVKSF